ADHLLAVSEEMKSYLEREFRCPGVTVVHNGGYPQSLRAHFSKPLRFLFSGILEYWEAPESLVELSRRLPPGSCTVIGSGSLLHETLASSPSLEYRGLMSHNKAIEVSTQYQIGLVPSSTDITRVVASPIK